MKKAPNVWQLKSLIDHLREGPSAEVKPYGYVPARPLGFYSLHNRIRAAWMVFTGRADALIWPGQL